MKTTEKAATKSRVKAKYADSPTTNSVHNELSEGHRAKLGELFKVIGGGTPTTQVSDYWIGNIPWISSADIDDDHRVSARKCISPAALKASTTNLVPANSVIVVTRVGLGKVAIAPTDMCFSQDCQALLFGEKEANPRFVLHQLGLATQIFRYISRGTTIPGVTKKQLLDLEFWLPPLPTQHRIVAEIEEKLSRLDAAQSALHRAQANLKRYRASVLQMACDQALLSAPMESFGKYVAHIESGKSFKCEERPPKDHEVGVAKVSAVTWGEYDEQQTKTCKDESRIEERYLIKPGDFLFTRANTIELIGACVIAKQVSLHIMLSDKILRFHFAESLDKRWALLWLKSHFGRKEIERLSTGNQESMRNIGQERIRQIQISVPSLETQSEIITEVERRLSVIDRTEQTLRTQLERAKRLRQSILQQAFKG